MSNRYRSYPHGKRIVTQCLSYIEQLIDDDVSRSESIRLCSLTYKIPKSNLYRWWKIYDTYGENHIVINEQMRKLKRLYGRASTSVSEVHVEELKQLVDNHPEYYLDEYVTALAQICGVFYHPSTISKLLRNRLGYSLQVLQEIASQRNENLRLAYINSLKHLLRESNDVSCLIFIDETHKDRSSSRRRKGWGKRNSGGSIINRWFREDVRYTLIAACDIHGFIPE